MKSSILKLMIMTGLASLDGVVPVAALSGLFVPHNAPMLAFAFIAGPGAITTAALIDGGMKERIIAALLAGIIATFLIVLSASLGPKLLSFVNPNIIKIFGAIAVFSISLLILGIKIPQSSPLIIILIGIILGGILNG
jgi:small neutral amino acid transporter SnatA (MarC family)